MCYSAMVEQRHKEWLRYQAQIAEQAFESLFERRLTDGRIRIAKALELNYAEPRTPSEIRTRAHIDAWRARAMGEHEAALFASRQRLADAERRLRTKQTKKALEDRRIASSKVEWHRRKLAELARTVPEPEDARIFPFWYAPVAIMEHGRLTVRPMRYHCRPHDKPASLDKRFGGLYNARRDSLEGFWGNLFGRRHGVAIFTSFFENVALHDFEHRALRPGEKPRNLVLHFDPQPAMPMLVACLWDVWRRPGAPELHSFATITDEPPPEVAATGHERCIIPLKEANLEAWLTPAGRDRRALHALLDDRERPYYAHAIAA